MYRVVRLLGLLALVISSIGQASAVSIQISPVTATGSLSDFTFSYSTAPSSPFTLADLSLSAPSGPNLLGGTLATYTTPTGGNLSGTGTLSEIISTTPGTQYTVSFDLAGGSLHSSVGAALSPVPLPASFPLFVMALIGLAMAGFYSARGINTAPI